MMKRVLISLLIIVLMLSILILLTACGKNGEKSSNNSTESGKASEASSDKSGFIEKSDEASLSRVEIDVFNKKFKTFEGEGKGTNDVNSIIDKIVSSNEGNPNKLVSVEFNGERISENSEIGAIRAKLMADKNYTISLEYNEDGMVNAVIITEN